MWQGTVKTKKNHLHWLDDFYLESDLGIRDEVE